MDVEQAGVDERVDRRADAVGEAALLADLVKQPRRGAPAQNVREQARGEIIPGSIGGCFEAERDVRLLAFGPANSNAAGEPRGPILAGLPRADLGQMALGKLDHLVMRYLARGG